MTGDDFREFFELQAGNSCQEIAAYLFAVKQQLRFCLLFNAGNEIKSAVRVERHDDHAAQQTAEERSDPFRAVFCPQQNAVTFANAALFKVTRKLVSGLRNLFTRPTNDSQLRLVREDGFPAAPGKIFHK